MVEKYWTSKLCCGCHTILHDHQHKQVCNDVEERRELWDTKRCTNKGCKVSFVNRDVDGPVKILMLGTF